MGLFGARVCHLLHHPLDPVGLQDQLVGKDLLGYHRRLLVGPAASSETRELVTKVELKFSQISKAHYTHDQWLLRQYRYCRYMYLLVPANIILGIPCIKHHPGKIAVIFFARIY